MVRAIDLNQFAETAATIAWLINPKTLHLTNTELKYVLLLRAEAKPGRTRRV
jgi:hypothetical protein